MSFVFSLVNTAAPTSSIHVVPPPSSKKVTLYNIHASKTNNLNFNQIYNE